ncbi:hypothetical protein J5X84_37340 [Streptosporangiaceae bacterium NEAU-GS5]|nr:hypothetical protein [Streptosporangiaceae bacterium NEAU-GS5]
MRTFFKIALVAVSTAIVALLGLPASAAPVPSDLVTVSGVVFTPHNVPVVGSVDCPSGYRMVGSAADQALLTAIAPNATFTGAIVSGFARDLPPNNFITMTVICAPQSRFTDVVVVQAADHRFRPGDFAHSLAKCPAGYYAFGGGGYFRKGTGPFRGSTADNVSNAPSADGTKWTFAGTMPSDTDTMMIITQCAPKTGKDFLVQFGNVSTSPTTKVGSFVNCPSGYTAIAGGYYISNPDGSEARPGTIQVSKPLLNGWAVSGLAPANTKMVALAQCLTP